MKKTLIVLMTLAGVAAAATTDTSWNFEKTYNSTYNAAGDNSYKGVTTGAVTLVASNATNGSVMGDGSTTNLGLSADFEEGSYIEYTGATDLVSQLGTGAGKSGDFTILTFVNFDNLTYTSGSEQGYFFFGTGSSTNGGIALGILSEGGSSKGSVDFLVKGKAHHQWDTTINADTWYHMAFAYSSQENEVTLYINGEKIGTQALTTNYGTPGTAAPGQAVANLHSGIVIGAGSTFSGQDDFDGSIADLQIITGAALTQEQVKQYAANIVPEPATATLSLLALAGLAARRRRK